MQSTLQGTKGKTILFNKLKLNKLVAQLDINVEINELKHRKFNQMKCIF